MAVTRTFSIIKPDATRRNLTGAVTKMLEEEQDEAAWRTNQVAMMMMMTTRAKTKSTGRQSVCFC